VQRREALFSFFPGVDSTEEELGHVLDEDKNAAGRQRVPQNLAKSFLRPSLSLGAKIRAHST
jgi:hypothetical protein